MFRCFSFVKKSFKGQRIMDEPYWTLFVIVLRVSIHATLAEDIPCNEPPLIVNAEPGEGFGQSSYVYPHNVTYSCYSNYVLSGENNKTCLRDGNWSDTSFNCSFPLHPIVTDNSSFVSLSSYDIIPTLQSFLFFEVKACSYAILAFSETDSPRSDMLEVILDGVSDSLYIKSCGRYIVSEYIPDVLDCGKYVELFLQWNKGEVNLGKREGDEYRHFLSYTFHFSCTSFTPNYLFIASQEGHESSWIFHKPQGKNVLLSTGNTRSYHRLSSVEIFASNRKEIVFQVKSCSGTTLLFAPIDNNYPGNYYGVAIGIVFSPDVMVSGLIYRNTLASTACSNNILDCNTWKSFYLAWNDTNFILGKIEDFASMSYTVVMNRSINPGSTQSSYPRNYIALSSFSYSWYRFILDCGPPPFVGNATVTASSTTHNATATYQCKDGWTSSGSNTLTCQSNGLWSTPEFQCTINVTGICGRPPAVQNGSYNLTSSVQYYIPGDVLLISCITGYFIEGSDTNQTTIQCTSNGTWDEATNCAVNCGIPPAVENAQFTQGNIFTPGQNVTYTCLTNHVITRLKTQTSAITCLKNGTWEKPLSCEVNCGRPAMIYDGYVTQGDVFTPGEKVTYTCYEGFVMNVSRLNEGTATCQPDGNWTSTPTCTVICGKPPVIKNGFDYCVTQVHVPGDTATIMCNDGHVVEETKETQTEIKCNSEGKWDTTPNCIVNCGAPPPVQNANVTAGQVFTPGQSVMYTCDSEFIISGLKEMSTNITCKEDGNWEQEPICQVNCGPPSQLANGAVTSGDIFTPGEEVTYTCDKGYVFSEIKSSKLKSACQNNGSWSFIALCIKNCGPPPTVTNSTNDAVGPVFVPNDEVTYQCESGYVIKGTSSPNTTLACKDNGNWEDTPVCVVNCGAPPDVSDASETPGQIFTPGQKAIYTCDSNFVILGLKKNSTAITCNENGNWEQVPRCIVNCGPPIAIGNGTVTSGDIFTPGEEVTHICDEGFIIEGTELNKATSMCNDDGSWSIVESCKRNCGPPPKVAHSTNTATGTVFVSNDEIEYECESDYVIKGTTSNKTRLECQSNGAWQIFPVCVVNCGPPSDVQYASRSPADKTIFTPGDLVTWTCNNRFVVEETNQQKAQVVCQDNGSWTSTPVCKAHCGEPPAVAHALFNGTGNQEGNRRTYSCLDGHALEGQSDITCLDTSEWESPPSCPADCGDAPLLRNGNLKGSGNLENNTRDVTCNDGYVLVGASSIKCLINGQWETLPVCQASAVNAFQKQFGNSERPLNTGTTVAMTLAILFFVLLCCSIIYMIVRSRSNQNTGHKKPRSSASDRRGNSNTSESGEAVSSSGRDYERPIPHAYVGDRSWREMWF